MSGRKAEAITDLAARASGYVLLACTVLAVSGCAVIPAQPGPYRSGPVHALNVESTPPILQFGHGADGLDNLRAADVLGGAYQNIGSFRMIFRVLAEARQGIPVALGIDLLRSEVANGWQATVLPAGRRCMALAKSVHGVHFNVITYAWAGPGLRGMQENSRPLDVFSATNPRHVQVDFHCDGPVRSGDRVSVRIRFYVFRAAGQWTPDDFVFESEPIQ